MRLYELVDVIVRDGLIASPCGGFACGICLVVTVVVEALVSEVARKVIGLLCPVCLLRRERVGRRGSSRSASCAPGDCVALATHQGTSFSQEQDYSTSGSSAGGSLSATSAGAASCGASTGPEAGSGSAGVSGGGSAGGGASWGAGALSEGMPGISALACWSPQSWRACAGSASRAGASKPTSSRCPSGYRRAS